MSNWLCCSQETLIAIKARSVLMSGERSDYVRRKKERRERMQKRSKFGGNWIDGGEEKKGNNINCSEGWWPPIA